MRGYLKRYLRNRVDAATSRKTETRDAILWDVLPNQRRCRVKIQGSEQLIMARYPENWEQTPAWLKPGNAVRIVHRGGIRGYVEIIGHGMNIPTPLAGGTAHPGADLPDVVLTGMEVNVAMIGSTDDDGNAIEIGTMQIIIEDGTYRIDSVIYSVSNVSAPMIMAADSEHIMGEILAMASDVVLLTVNPVTTAGYYRYDLVVAGTDGIVEIYEGAEGLEPVMPDTPAEHLLLCFILVVSDMDEVRPFHINRYWEEPEASGMFIITHGGIVAYGTSPWIESPGTLVRNFTKIKNTRNVFPAGGDPPHEHKYDVHCYVINQYGLPIKPAAGAWYVTLKFTVPPPTMDYGWGPMSNQFKIWGESSGNANIVASSAIATITTSNESARFTWQQSNAWPSFVLQCSCTVGETEFTAAVLVEQLDGLGEPCWMPPEVPPWYDDEWYIEWSE